jgi:diguanylate cyclase (GGDEF)-like protein/PAS domain S-box-containing protein
MQQHVDSRQKRLESILDNAGEGIITISEERRIETFNNAAQALFGYGAEEVAGRDVQYLLAEPKIEENAQFLRRLLGADPLKGGRRFTTTVTAKRANGDAFPLSVNLSELRVDDRLLFIAIVEDVSERQAMVQHLKHLAEHDSLTGLYNRQYFMEELERVVNRAARKRSGVQYGLLYIDLDNFKFVNDTLGHIAGDKVLVEVTSLLRKRLRKSDLLARLGGDEFAVLLYEVDMPQAEQAAEFYRQQLSEYVYRYEGKAIDVGCSIGVAMFTPDVHNKEDLLARADIACHIAKRTGRNSVHVYEPDDKENMTIMYADMGWARRIKHAIETNQFMFACQPIAHTQSLVVSSYEVLLRLRDENDVFVMPAGFLPSAERFGLMLDIDRWIINHAIAALGALRRTNPHLRYSVNLSSKAVCDGGILDTIKEALGRYGVDPAAITFEITETVAIGNMGMAVQFLEQLRALGCFTALDDFGVGYSSFAYLKDLPVDYVKIDGSFVKDVGENVLHRAMVKSMNEVAHAIGKQTVAEFVESAESLGVLREIGVDYVQGYHIGMPMVVDVPDSNDAGARVI